MDKDKILCLSPLPDTVVMGLFTMKVGPEQAQWVTSTTLRREATKEELINAVGDADCIIGDYRMNTFLDAEVMKAASRCRLIQQPSAGYQHIDIEAAQAQGIPVANVAGANSVSVAEHTIMVALACLKKLLLCDQKTKAAQWVQDDMANYGVFELMGRTFGIVGMGRVGQKVAIRAKAFGCNLLYYDVQRRPDEEEVELEVTYRPLNELLAESDVISLHTPLTPETENLLSEERIAGAAFDVFTTEPISPENPLLDAPNTILTPHLAGATNESRLRIIDFALGNIARALAGDKPKCLVTDVVWPRPVA
jgi:phosphoglycerate dehydrogenase-like enzyme